MELREWLLVILAILVFAVTIARIRKRKPKEAPTATPVSAVPVSVPTVPQNTVVQHVITAKPVVFFEEVPRSARICPCCDGENDWDAAYCRICAGKLR